MAAGILSSWEIGTLCLKWEALPASSPKIRYPAVELQEGGTPSRAESGLLSNVWKWTVQGGTRAVKGRDFTGKGRPRRAGGWGNPGDCSATWLTVSGFMVMGLVFALSLAKHSDSGSFLVAHTSLGQDGCQRGGFWEVVQHVAPPLDIFQTSGWWWLINSMFLPRTSCHKTTHINGYCGAWTGQDGRFQLACYPWPLSCLVNAFGLEG